MVTNTYNSLYAQPFRENYWMIGGFFIVCEYIKVLIKVGIELLSADFKSGIELLATFLYV